MGGKKKEIEDIEKNIEGLKLRMENTKSHLASIELIRQIEDLERQKVKLEKDDGNWIIG
jgi:hypothetical protein